MFESVKNLAEGLGVEITLIVKFFVKVKKLMKLLGLNRWKL